MRGLLTTAPQLPATSKKLKGALTKNSRQLWQLTCVPCFFHPFLSPFKVLTLLPTLVQERVRKWLSELELAFFHQLERSLPEGEVAYLRPVLGTDGSHAAHALAKYAVQARGGYRRRMIYGV